MCLFSVFLALVSGGDTKVTLSAGIVDDGLSLRITLFNESGGSLAVDSPSMGSNLSVVRFDSLQGGRPANSNEPIHEVFSGPKARDGRDRYLPISLRADGGVFYDWRPSSRFHIVDGEYIVRFGYSPRKSRIEKYRLEYLRDIVSPEYVIKFAKGRAIGLVIGRGTHLGRERTHQVR